MPPLLHSCAYLRASPSMSASPRDRKKKTTVVVIKLRGRGKARVRDVVDTVLACHIDMGATRAQLRQLRARLAVDDAHFDAWCRGIDAWCPLLATTEDVVEGGGDDVE